MDSYSITSELGDLEIIPNGENSMVIRGRNVPGRGTRQDAGTITVNRIEMYPSVHLKKNEAGEWDLPRTHHGVIDVGAQFFHRAGYDYAEISFKTRQKAAELLLAEAKKWVENSPVSHLAIAHGAVGGPRSAKAHAQRKADDACKVYGAACDELARAADELERCEAVYKQLGGTVDEQN